jgi:flagellar capping protein FliD
MTEKVQEITDQCDSIKTEIEEIDLEIKTLQDRKQFLEEQYKKTRIQLLNAVKEALKDSSYD